MGQIQKLKSEITRLKKQLSTKRLADTEERVNEEKSFEKRLKEEKERTKTYFKWFNKLSNACVKLQKAEAVNSGVASDKIEFEDMTIGDAIDYIKTKFDQLSNAENRITKKNQEIKTVKDEKSALAEQLNVIRKNYENL